MLMGLGKRKVEFKITQPKPYVLPATVLRQCRRRPCCRRLRSSLVAQALSCSSASSFPLSPSSLASLFEFGVARRCVSARRSCLHRSQPCVSSLNPQMRSSSRILVKLLKRHSHTATSSSRFSTPPPHEVVEPFYDLSDVVVSASRDPPSPSPWLPQILSLLDGSPSMESNLTSFCNKFLITLSPNFVSHTLRSLTNQPLLATRFFHWAHSQPSYSHSLHSYVSLIETLSFSSSFDSTVFQNILQEFKCRKFKLTAAAVNSLLRSFAAVGMVEELLWMWRNMKEDGLEPSLYNFNSLMNGLVNAGMVESAVRVFEAMREVNVRPDSVSYNTVIKGYCKVGKTRKALEMIREMEAGDDDGNVGPDKVSYMTVMQACYGEGDVDCCVRLYHEMKEKGLVVPPHAYSLVVCGLCRQGKVVEGLNVFEEMRRDSCGANKAVYTALIDGYAKTGNVDGAMRLFERMRQEGIKPDEVTYGAIVNGLCKGGRVEEALGYLEFCKENGVMVNAVFYSSLIDGLGKAGRVDEAEKLFYEMVDKGCPPDSYCYNALIDGWCKGGRIDEALALFQRMEEEGCEQTVYTYTILISELFKVHRNEEALKLWDKMIDKGITPNVACFRALSIGLCLSGKVARACKILDELAPMGIVLETAYEDMINVLCKAGRVKEACKLADGIVDRGREIPGKVRTLMINALRKAGNADLAIRLMHSKIGIGYDRMRSVKKRVKFQTLIGS
ncbi:hypothetical protein Ahy_A09g046565 isoform D [Arachis hypogaea]|uniref:Pentatricopeptide repeat-containing protein n=2 Tax=Arachis hypogaea TaxID=3818 RepID=A0A445BQB2_ARAHY|nr:hypothetical protein Ahy_A09g046565 isoform D [Arachis hypogaea]